MSQFSPALIEPVILTPLRDFFHTFGPANKVYWDPDEKKTSIEISAQFDANKQGPEFKPRILVSRGSYAIDKTGLTDSMESAPTVGEAKGLLHRKHMVFYRGMATVTIEARNRGVCELLTDMVSHFLLWSRPFLCDALGFMEFGMPMQVSDCVPGKEDTDKHSVTISLPYLKSEEWRVDEQGVILKDIFLRLENRIHSGELLQSQL